MDTPKVESFLEKSDMNFLFCLLTKLEIQRINQLPSHVKQRFPKKITEMAMEHVSENDVPDYITEIAEAELAMAAESAPKFDDDNDFELEEETIDDSKRFIEEFPDDESEIEDKAVDEDLDEE